MSGAKKPDGAKPKRKPKSGQPSQEEIAQQAEQDRETREFIATALSKQTNVDPAGIALRFEEFRSALNEAHAKLYGASSYKIPEEHYCVIETDIFAALNPTTFAEHISGHRKIVKSELARTKKTLRAVQAAAESLDRLEALVAPPMPRRYERPRRTTLSDLRNANLFIAARNPYASGEIHRGRDDFLTALGQVRSWLKWLGEQNTTGLNEAKAMLRGKPQQATSKRSVLRALTEACWLWTSGNSLRPGDRTPTMRQRRLQVRALVTCALKVAPPPAFQPSEIPFGNETEDYRTVTSILDELAALTGV